uniref:Decapping nuclease n=1 Tax=Caenorhabditis tropicalis TaxID=1561998 RepID=A0A1I7T2R1_9PELO
MPVKVNIERVGTFKKFPNRTVQPGALPPRLNESDYLYGDLDEELDLSLGSEGFRDVGKNDRYQSFFNYLRKTSPQGSSMKEVIGADFVSNRRNLLVLAKSAYDIDRMDIQAYRQNGVIFLCDKGIDRRDNGPSYGYKFEQYMTLGKNRLPHDKYEKVSNGSCVKAVLRTTLSSGEDQLKVLYAAEVDAIDKNKNYVEIKTTGMDHDLWLERGSLRDYLQSSLAGVPYIIYGQKRSNTPFVYETRKVYTEDIPKEDVYWKKEVCYKQLFDVLQKIQSKLEYDDEAIVVKVRKDGLSFEPECSKNCVFMDPQFLDHFDN